METLSTIDWDQQESADVRAGIFRAIVDTAQLTATAYRRDPSSSWEEDRHPQDDITSVPERTIDFVFPQSIHLTAGSSTLPGVASRAWRRCRWRERRSARTCSPAGRCLQVADWLGLTGQRVLTAGRAGTLGA